MVGTYLLCMDYIYIHITIVACWKELPSFSETSRLERAGDKGEFRFFLF